MEYQVEWLFFSWMLLSNSVLQVLQDRWGQNNVAWLVYAVDIAERCSDHVATTLSHTQLGHSGECIFRSREQLGVVLGFDAVFFASDNTCEICRAGYQTHCVNRQPGAATGAQSEYVRVPLADG